MAIVLPPMVIVNVCVPLLGRPPPESVTCTVTVDVPGTVGVPDSIPELLNVSP